MSALIPGFFNVSELIPFMIFAIPIVAIVGGITTAIVKQITDSKLIENAQRERLAAIQRGIDPAQLPPLPIPGQTSTELMAGFNPTAAARHRAQGLLIGGIVTMFGGVGLGMFLFFITGPGDAYVWSVGILPFFIGVALLISAWIVWPRGGNGGGTGTGGPTGFGV